MIFNMMMIAGHNLCVMAMFAFVILSTSIGQELVGSTPDDASNLIV